MILTFRFSPIDRFYYIYVDGKEVLSSIDRKEIFKKWDSLKKETENKNIKNKDDVMNYLNL